MIIHNRKRQSFELTFILGSHHVQISLYSLIPHIKETKFWDKRKEAFHRFVVNNLKEYEYNAESATLSFHRGQARRRLDRDGLTRPDSTLAKLASVEF